MGEATTAPPINQRSQLPHILDNVNRVCHYHKLFTELLRPFRPIRTDCPNP